MFLWMLADSSTEINELVTIKRQTSEHEYECMASNFIYTNAEGKQYKHILDFKEASYSLKRLPMDRDKLPPPIDKTLIA